MCFRGQIMCGIFGFIALESWRNSPQDFEKSVKNLFLLSETRGKEAAGLAVINSDTIKIHKTPLSASKMLLSDGYKAFMAKALLGWKRNTSMAAIGHARLVTNGLQFLDNNNQPVAKSGAVVVHNGIIVNDAALWSKYSELNRDYEVDTEIVAELLQYFRGKGFSVPQAVGSCFQNIQGEASIAAAFDDENLITLATNTGSLYWAIAKDNSAAFFVSEGYMAQKLTKSPTCIKGFEGITFQRLNPGYGLIIDLGNLNISTYSLNLDQQQSTKESEKVTRRQLSLPGQDEAKWRQNIRRCSKCILPETMPFIEFDDNNVCNFCKSYQPQKLKGKESLENELAAIRSNDGSPDCLVAFSGGRDSSMGVHLLVKEYGMNPIAYTYDWGMVTDIARRNQARICGQLGIEHLWVSADIKGKRRNIRKNVSAWLQNPSLGMVPLFMAGDKQFFWYANQYLKTTGIKKIIFCMNGLERTDFKTGFAGVPAKKGDGKHYHIDLKSKLQLAHYYGAQFLLNPRYLNASLFDTLFAYVSYYFINQDHLYLFDYIKWDEQEVNRTLIDEYGWETANDTPTTWRIGDGTAAFYNYIYYTVAGFTENDTLRSNQIREGVLTRDEAIRLVEQENQPRWPSIQEYLRTIGIDIGDAIRSINTIPKLYDPHHLRRKML